jgi:hypothetical protein
MVAFTSKRRKEIFVGRQKFSKEMRTAKYSEIEEH